VNLSMSIERDQDIINFVVLCIHSTHISIGTQDTTPESHSLQVASRRQAIASPLHSFPV
jgi:hypothetical protein